MERDDWWITRFNDNRVKGILQELHYLIETCDDPELLHKLRATLNLGFVNFAARKERELRGSTQ